MSDPSALFTSATVALWRALRRLYLDLAVGALGVAFGAVSLTFPFGRDQGLYFFVGREWLQHGEMPYRDALEQKTPAIFLLHALAIAVFGEHMWSIRVFELGCLIALGPICARLATPMERPVPPGLAGFTVLAAAVTYVGFFNFWDTAQCEIWCAATAVAAAAAASRLRREGWAPLVAGLLGGVSLVFKPPGAALVAVAFTCSIARALRAPERRVRVALLAGLSFGLAAATPWALVIAYFAIKGALPAMVDVLVGANSYYILHEARVHSAAEVFAAYAYYIRFVDPLESLLGLGMIVGVVVGIVRRDREVRDRHLLAAAMLVAALLGVVVQFKFYGYHWSLISPPSALAAANLALDLQAGLTSVLPRFGAALTPWVAATALLGAYAPSGVLSRMWVGEVELARDLVTGAIRYDEFARPFRMAHMDYAFYDDYRVAKWLHENTSPADQVAVRAFEPAIYALAGRRYAGRFFWTEFLTQPSRAYRREEWLEQDREEFAAIRPRWVVVNHLLRDGPGSPQYFLRDYFVRTQIGNFAILERRGPSSQP